MKNVLVFPCGSEIGLEVYKSLKNSIHFNLIGASSVPDHGRFVFKDNYISDVPYFDDDDFIDEIKKIIKKYKIDVIYPTMDIIIKKLKENEHNFDCKIISPSKQTVDICTSKRKMYIELGNIIPVPKVYINNKIFPLFVKPDNGSSSRNTYLAKDEESLNVFLKDKDITIDFVFCEYLPGKEYTIDCFTDRNNNLLFCRGRHRSRIMNGISVNAVIDTEYQEQFLDFAKKISNTLNMRGAWFFQMKLDKDKNLKLLEIAARFGGSSVLFRNKGINFASLSLFDVFDYDVSIIENDYNIELDRALSNKFKIDIEYDRVYLDYDDSVIINNQVNTDMIKFIYESLNQNKEIVLLTKHNDNIDKDLKKYKLSGLFNNIVHLNSNDKKSNYIDILVPSIFIDDSYAERLEVKKKHNIPVFSLDMIESLI